ncbi:hypothetical protein PA598K_00117 [Paenibacillus sp. 598K]|uniref:AAA family ATPase n=1 Tax=Paenibacillus sp. 598K TaxID=1117987 RepID=UPI000FF9B233|nr:AAA family ATPase [Paenibacillus sp. 598K]GBF71904.1 hypothetical protein PA598K_00117 [Paenibacillus sp. 598K]
MKIRIVGACGSGKTTLARTLSQTYDVPYYELDNLTWDRSEGPSRRRAVEERDRLLQEIVSADKWIIEGAQHTWGRESLELADVILILQPHRLLRDFRVFRRFVRTRLGLEASPYRQTFSDLIRMLRVWNRDYDREGYAIVMELTERCADKRAVVSDQAEALAYVEAYQCEQTKQRGVDNDGKP